MRKEPEAHAQDERKRKDLIEARNQADNTVYTADKALKEFGDKVPADVKSEIEAKSAAVKKAAESDDAAAIQSATEALGQVIQKIGASVYQGQPEAGEPQANPNPDPNAGPDVVDGEVKE